MALGFLAPLAGFALKGAEALALSGAQDDLARRNRIAATRAYRLNSTDLAARSNQTAAAAAQEQDALSQQGAAAVSTASASAAESGVSGGSVTQLLNDYLGQEALAKDTVARNAEIAQAEISRRKQAALYEYQDRIAMIPGSNPLLTGLRLGSAALDFGPQILPYLGKRGGTNATAS